MFKKGNVIEFTGDSEIPLQFRCLADVNEEEDGLKVESLWTQNEWFIEPDDLSLFKICDRPVEVLNGYKMNKRIFEQSAIWAKQSFELHCVDVLHKHELYRHYRCAKPGTGVYRFDIITWPGYLAVVGDIGDLLLCRTADMLAWAENSIHDAGYMAEKTIRPIDTEEESEELMLAILKEAYANKFEYNFLDRGTKPTAEERVYSDLSDEFQLVQSSISDGRGPAALYDTGWFDEFPDIKVYNSNFRWCQQALLWFFANYDWRLDKPIRKES